MTLESVRLAAGDGVLDGIILLAATDVGPAKYLSRVGAELDCSFRFCSSDLARSCFEAQGIDAYREEDEVQVRLLITGTALDQCIDKQLVVWARERNIPSLSVIEHWSWYRRRFELEGQLVLPDAILVNDEYALEAAIEEGLPSERLAVAGNPLLEDLMLLSATDRTRMDASEGRTVLFVSEQLAVDFNGTPNDLGYDEFSVLEDLLRMLGEQDRLVIKLHPEESTDKYSDYVCGQVDILRQATLQQMDAMADVIVGMASMLLLELAMLRNDVVSYRPNSRHSFIGGTLGATVDIRDYPSLREQFLSPHTAVGDFRTRFNGSLKRLSSLVEERLK